MIEPALTAEEWAARAVDAGDGWKDRYGHQSSYVDLHEKDGYLWAEAGDASDFYGQGAGRVGNRHGLAALCLYGQPFGFTREDVDMLRALELLMEPEEALGLVRDLADRIEKLLPPEGA